MSRRAGVEASRIRAELRMLVEHIPDDDVAVARRLLRAFLDPERL